MSGHISPALWGKSTWISMHKFAPISQEKEYIEWILRVHEACRKKILKENIHSKNNENKDSFELQNFS